MAAAAILVFQKFKNFNGLSHVGGQFASPRQISSKIGQTIAEICRFNSFFQNGAVRYLGFVGRALGPPAKTTWWSLSLC